MGNETFYWDPVNDLLGSLVKKESLSILLRDNREHDHFILDE